MPQNIPPIQYQMIRHSPRSFLISVAVFAILLLGTLNVAPAKATYVKLCGPGDREVFWYLLTPTTDLTAAAQKQAISNGMALWGQVANVKFTETTSLLTADTLIRFVTGDHGDGTPFYSGGISAHSFPHCYPSNAGDTHFNDWWKWTATPPSGPEELDLTTVAAHESGHVLGLGDSGVIGEMMGLHASVQHYLAWEDIRGIQAIYGRANGTYHLRNSNTSGPSETNFLYQNLGDNPVVGDWNGDGFDTVGTYRPSNLQFYLMNTNSTGHADYNFAYGGSGYRPIAGDWNGDGIDSVGHFRPSTASFILKNVNSGGGSDYVFNYGASEDLPVAGDWNGDGIDSIGVYRPSNSTFYLRNSNSTGVADLTINFGEKGDLPVVGDWDGDGVDTIGVYRQSNATFYMRNSNAPGSADITALYGKDPPLASGIIANPLPVSGDWDGSGSSTIGLYQN